jgi:5-methylcytosine-specific restriction protein A
VKRSPLTRRSPLAAISGLRRTTQLARGSAKPRRQRDTGPTRAVRKMVRDRAQGQCEYCRQEPGTQWHHRRPRALGGSSDPATNRPSNLVLLGRCHELLESQRAVALAKGWLVRQGDDPAAVPVEMGAAKVLLTDEGTYITLEVI